MRTHTEKSRPIILSAAVVFILTAVFFCVRFYNTSEVVKPDNPFSELSESLAAEDAEKDGEGKGFAESLSDESRADDNSSEKAEDNNSQADNKNDGENAGLPAENDSVNTSEENEGENPTDIRPTSLEKAETVDGTNKKEYFRTSIKDGERVTHADYSFTITHTDKSLKVKKVTVTVNGEEIPQFSGKCRLSGGKNTIRVACTYTDKNGSVKRAYKDYTVYCDPDELVIDTDLSDMQTDNPVLDFTAQAYLGKKKAKLSVYVNGEILNGEKNYTAELSEGENTIGLYAEKDGKTAEKSFVISYFPAEFSIETDLSDMTVDSETLEFYAALKGESEKGKLTAAVNGKTVRGNGGRYVCTLETGENRIRLRAVDGGKKIEQSYTVTYVPVADEKTRPKLTDINVSEGMSVKGSGYTLKLSAEDHLGNRIYADKTEVYLNGVLQRALAQDSVQTYYLRLSGGENQLEIRIYDSEGRYADFAYTINSYAVSRGEQIGTVSISLDAAVLGLDELAAQSEIPIYEGENGSDAIKRFLEQNGFGAEFTGAEGSEYLKRITKDNAFEGIAIDEELIGYLQSDGISENGISDSGSLGEGDHTNSSGWVYTVNGKMPSYGISQIGFSDGDTVRLTFTLCGGKEIAGSQNSYDRVW